ncbi:hypothetical protein [Pseudomonas parafulva]|uniref:hypothetical protein n=1 Tax=Pseudomonas parafulva TaxID=157782 RepID=UPI000540FC1D|nr:hypothetical protein [Pseudomonas parafulva]AIZ33322.1 hypothetical protein NJ69_10165 [Pseudomonas parafulva]
MDDESSNLYRVAQAIVSIPCSISAIDRQDILDTLLLAQLSASRQHDAFDAPDKWAVTCLASLNNLHWSMTSFLNRTETLTDTFSIKSLAENTTSADLLERLSVEARLRMFAYTNRERSDLSQKRVATVRIVAPDRFDLKSLHFDCAQSPEDNWITQQHYATTHRPVSVKVREATFTRTADYDDVRMRVIKALGTQRVKEIEPL